MSDDESSDFWRIDGVEEQTARRRDDEFLPWHKPRKHWVREKQWGVSIANFVNRHLDLSQRPLAYLTFPGEDFLDVRYLHSLAVKESFNIEFQGFNSQRSTQAEISLSEVRDLPRIDEASDIIPYAFETIAKMNSLGREAATRHLGFDVVNLDFCNSVASLDAGTRGSALDAIVSLVELQTQRRVEPWMLFVTSQCDPASVSETVKDRFADIFNRNCDEKEFERAAGEELGLSKDIASLFGGSEAVDVAANFNFFGLAFTKWLIGVAYANWEVSPGNLAGYRVYNNDEGCDMLSSVFYFKRVHAQHVDSTGIAAERNSIKRKSERILATKAITKIADFTDVDSELWKDAGERTRLVKANAHLLAEARYDFNKAEAWGSEVCWKPSKEPQNQSGLDAIE